MRVIIKIKYHPFLLIIATDTRYLFVMSLHTTRACHNYYIISQDETHQISRNHMFRLLKKKITNIVYIIIVCVFLGIYFQFMIYRK